MNFFVATFCKNGEDIDVFYSIERGKNIIVGISNGRELNPGEPLWRWAMGEMRNLRGAQIRTWDDYDFDKKVEAAKAGRVGDS